MNRFIAFVGVLLALVGFGVSASPALASNPSCSTHSSPIQSWSVQGDWLTYYASFQCGGAENDDFYVDSYLQVYLNGDWHLADCDTGLCFQTHPNGTVCPNGYFCAGNLYHFSGTYYYYGNIDNKKFRIQSDVNFRSGYHIYYYSNSIST